jgi:flagellar capping protein FliD
MKQCCTDKNGNPKRKYQTKEEAEKSAEQISDNGIAIKVYQCEDGNGWHLTSLNAPSPERPKNVMTEAERKQYSKSNDNSLGSLFDKEFVRQLKKDSHNNTLDALDKKIKEAQEELEKKENVYQEYRKKFIEIRNKFNLASIDMKEAKQKLLNAENEYKSAKRKRI